MDLGARRLDTGFTLGSLLASLNALELLLPRLEELDTLVALCKVAFLGEGILFSLEQADDLVNTGFKLGECFLKGVRILDGSKDRALGSMRFERIGIGCDDGR